MNLQHKNKYSPADHFSHRGLDFSANRVVATSDHRLKVKINLHDPRTGKKLYTKSTSIRQTELAIEEKQKQLADELWQANRYALLEKIITERISNITLDAYFQLKFDVIRVQRSWAGAAEKHKHLWESTLSELFGSKTLQDYSRDYDLPYVLMEQLYHRRASKDAMSSKESYSWHLLHDIFDSLIADGFLTDNPAHAVLGKNKRSENEKALREIATKHMSVRETQQFVAACIQRSAENPLYNPLLISFILCLRIEEVCALDLQDCVELEGVTWLNITKEYRQERSKPPYHRTMLDSQNQYRRAVCTAYAEHILAKHLLNRHNQNASLRSPMFVDNRGERATPSSIKELRNALINEVFKSKIIDSGHNVMQHTAKVHLRTRCELSAPEIAVIMGTAPGTTAGEYYIDWNNHLVMMNRREHLSRWHKIIFSQQNSIPVTSTIYTIEGDLNVGDTLTIDSKSGFSMLSLGGKQNA